MGLSVMWTRSLFMTKNPWIPLDKRDNECIIPIEVLEKKRTITIGVYAYIVKEENGEEILKKRFSPAPAKIFMDYGSYVKDAENASTPTPTEMEQIQQLASDINTQINIH